MDDSSLSAATRVVSDAVLIDKGALTMALNVLDRAGKSEVAAELRANVDALNPLAAAPALPAPKLGVEPVGWTPIETAPKDGTEFLAWYPKLRLDDHGDATDEVIGGHMGIVTCRDGQWDEPQWLDASGAYYLDDWCFADMPTLWRELPPAPGATPTQAALQADVRDAALEDAAKACERLDRSARDQFRAMGSSGVEVDGAACARAIRAMRTTTATQGDGANE